MPHCARRPAPHRQPAHHVAGERAGAALYRHHILNSAFSSTPGRNVGGLISVAAGASLACAFAPLGYWPLAILAPAVLIWLWEGAAPLRAAWLGLCFAAGTFAAGTYWLYISIHVFGEAPIWLAFAIMGALIAIMASYHALLGYVVARWLPASGTWRWLIGIPAAWLFSEWWRGWFLSGFPWLSLGYSQSDTWLASLAPVVGVYGLSALLLLSSGALFTLWRGKRKQRIAAAIVLVLPWLAALLLARVEWTRSSGEAVSIAILQGAIPQDMKWQANNLQHTLDLYADLNEQALGAQLIVWPEAAAPDLANNLTKYLGEIHSRSARNGSDVVMGVVRVDDDGERYFNSMLALGPTVQFYDKGHLVPFGEYFPVPAFVRSWLRLMSLPYSDFTAGAARQAPLQAAGIKLAASICYEDAYATSQLAAVRASGMLVNVTNDAWFGRSSARHQHFQIARLRAIEAQRYLLRAANDGITAVIGPRGQVVAQAPQFEPAVLRASAVPRGGVTPFLRFGNWPVITLASLAFGLALRRQRTTNPRRTST
ncbi:MAG: apolipoprotein N-acyltransferase [Steroidobacteraceae bacterium]